MSKLPLPFPIRALLLSSLITLTACGGGGSSGGSDDPVVDDPIVTDPVVTEPEDVVYDPSETDASGAASGTLTLSEGAVITAVSGQSSDYGTFSINEAGSWTYSVVATSPGLYELIDGESVDDVITVTDSAEAEHTLTISAEGVDDAPEIGTGTGVDSGTIAADSSSSATGTLTITDPDADQSVFIAQTNTVGSYGLFSIDINGAWAYTLSAISSTSLTNISTAAVSDESDTFSVTSFDGTEHDVVILVTGIDDSEPAEPGVCVSEQYTIDSASDDGTSQEAYPPSLTIDGNSTDDTSRWSSEGVGKEIIFDLGEAKDLAALQIKFLKGDERNSYFSIETSIDESTWASDISDQSSSGSSSTFEVFNLSESVNARYFKIIGLGNSVDDNNWNSIIEVEAYKCELEEPVLPEPDPEPSIPDAGLPDTALGGTVILPNATGIDLLDWDLSIPVDEGDGFATSISENDLDEGYTHSDFFYGIEETDGDKGIVMMSPTRGYTTSENTYYVRVELRELLGRGTVSSNTSIDNNWVFSSAPDSAQADAAGVDGELNVTMVVNHVTETYGVDLTQAKPSDVEKALEDGAVDGVYERFDFQLGRVVIGQIHASSDEPIRLYYRKLPSHTKGSIYYYHEPTVGDEVLVDIIGSKNLDDDDAEPSDGIALNEKFSYNITVTGNDLDVTITRDDGTTVKADTFDMSASGFDTEDEWHYFKAGLYHLNNTAADGDYTQATFYEIRNAHTGYAESE